MKLLDRILISRADEQTELHRARAELGHHDRARLVERGGYLPLYAAPPVKRRSPCLGGCGRMVKREGRGYCVRCHALVALGCAVDGFTIPTPQECARAKAPEPGGWFGIQRAGNSRRRSPRVY